MSETNNPGKATANPTATERAIEIYMSQSTNKRTEERSY